MRHLIRTTVTSATLVLAGFAFAAVPASASYQGTTTQGPRVVIDIDCLTILARVTDLNEMVDALNDSANQAWDAWKAGDISTDDMRGNIRDNESAANQVEEAYGQAAGAWAANGCRGSLPPLNTWDFPWRDLGIGG